MERCQRLQAIPMLSGLAATLPQEPNLKMRELGCLDI